MLGGKPDNDHLLQMIEFQIKVHDIRFAQIVQIAFEFCTIIFYYREELRDHEKQYNPMKISELSKYFYIYNIYAPPPSFRSSKLKYETTELSEG